jgi:glyoxylase-like metal-dependent hydrolase (beta-lactamase superfamily II)
MAWLSRFYPRGPINLGSNIHPLPPGGTVPGMPGWRWIHTPGHSPGHISLYRESDRCLIVGDAFVTTKQESMICAFTQPQGVHPPPAYYTIDWQLARRSIDALAELEPEIAATGHGKPMHGQILRDQLSLLSRDFDDMGIPQYGRYTREPAIADEDGVHYVPPPVVNPRQATVAASVALVAAALMGYRYTRKYSARRARLRMAALMC